MRPAYIKFRAYLDKHPFWTSFLAGALATLSLPPAYVMPAFLMMGWVLYRAATAANWKHCVAHIGLGAYGWFLTSLYWVSHSLLIGDADYWFMLPFSFFGIPILVTVFWMAGALGAYWAARTSAGRAMMLVVMIGAAEWGREFIATGFPWNAPGLIALGTAPTAALGAIFGQTGLNFIMLLAAAIWPILILLPTRQQRRIFGVVMGMAVLFLGAASYHLQKVTPLTPSDEDKLIRIVQPAVPQADKWNYEKRPTHLARLTALSRAPAAKGATLVIWPESAFAGDYHGESTLVHALGDQIANHHQERSAAGQLLTGVLRFDAQNQLRNSALLLAEDGTSTLYDKTHLVPFGEYVPWRFIPFIDAIAGPTDFIEGDAVRPIFVPEIGLVLPLICYEAIFPALTGTATQRPHIIVNLTNDGWFGHTAGPYQHLAQTRMTAISYGIAVIRVANGGISAVFDGKGRQEQALALGKAGFFDVPRPAVFAPTIFARYGWLTSFMIVIVGFMFAIGLDRSSQKRQ